MSFSFGFNGDDIEDEGQEDLAQDMSKTTISPSEDSNIHALPPKRHSLEELVS